MRLGTDGRARLDLRIVDYQFPDNRDDGRSWSFCDPCLWLTEPGDPDIFDYFLLATMPVAQVRLAAQGWERMVAAHPGR